jgi:hypothetical protein
MIKEPKQFESTRGRCAITGRILSETEEFFCALFEEGESFRRMDVCKEAWNGPPENCYCFFKTRVPTRQKRKRLFIDDQALTAFFVRLEPETEPVRMQFRFVLALLLMRKRLLRYEGSSSEGGTERWNMFATWDQSKHQVVNPRLTDDQIEGVSRQLTAILHGDMGDWSDETEPLTNLNEVQPDESA